MSRDATMQTARLSYRRILDEDVELLVALNAEPAVMRLLGSGRPLTRDQTLADELPRCTADNDSRDNLGFWAAFAEGEFVGWFAAAPVDGTTDEVELGYRLLPAVWGNGYATEGAHLMVALARAAGVSRVVATTMAVNIASRRVLEHAGLRHVRTWFGEWDEPIEGSEHGDVDYALELT